MTLEEAEKKINELYQEHGKDFVIHAGNHPEILRALNDDIVKQMEAEREEIVAGEKKRKLEDISVAEICEIAVQAGQDAGRRAAALAAEQEHDDE